MKNIIKYIVCIYTCISNCIFASCLCNCYKRTDLPKNTRIVFQSYDNYVHVRGSNNTPSNTNDDIDYNNDSVSYKNKIALLNIKNELCNNIYIREYRSALESCLYPEAIDILAKIATSNNKYKRCVGLYMFNAHYDILNKMCDMNSKRCNKFKWNISMSGVNKKYKYITKPTRQSIIDNIKTLSTKLQYIGNIDDDFYKNIDTVFLSGIQKHIIGLLRLVVHNNITSGHLDNAKKLAQLVNDKYYNKSDKYLSFIANKLDKPNESYQKPK